MNLYIWKRNNTVGFFSGFTSLGEWGKFHQITSPNSYNEIPLCETIPLNRELTKHEKDALDRFFDKKS